MPETDQSSAKAEQKFHNYTSNAIPWYVRVLWLLFWAFVIYYTVTYLLPAIQTEMVSPP
ncbi:MAG: hypothetical protein ISQ06_06020 [Planctomycetaceae bacterium]|jgi:hypothetical protein|nr:hypothetical protein [Planctomycetaceae bacterium]